MPQHYDITGARHVDLLPIVSSDTHLKHTARNYYAGPCPFCGGTDRFVVKLDPVENIYKYYCRVCGDGKYHDVIDYIMRRDNARFAEAIKILTGETPHNIDPAVVAEREKLIAVDREKRIAELAEHLKKYSTSEIWEAFHNRMGEENREWWRSSGIPDDWQDWWKLGYVAEKKFEYNDELLTSPAYTIPKFTYGWNPVNMDYRLVNPPETGNKYRPAPGMPAAPFLSRPDTEGPADEVYIVEGSKKAMVLTCASGIDIDLTVFGVPSKNSWAGVVDQVKNCGRVWIILDPDAFDWAVKMGKAIGPAARIIRLPYKVDDGILDYGLTIARLESAKRWAIRPDEARL